MMKAFPIGAVLCSLLPLASAQTVSGSLIGTVADAGGACSSATTLRDYTSTTFGTITGAQVQARHMSLTMRFRF